MKSAGVDVSRGTARLWAVAALVAAVDAGVASANNPETVLHFMAVLALCVGMALWSRLAVVR